jgi:hypothetical protein
MHSDNDHIQWVLRPDPQLKSGLPGAVPVMRANLEAEGLSITSLRWVFAAGAASSLGIIWMELEVLAGPPYSSIQLLLLCAPWLAVYYLFGGALALQKIPVTMVIKGVVTLLAATILAALWFTAQSWYFVAAAMFAFVMGGTHLIAYTLVFLDRNFSHAAEVIRTVQTKLDKKRRSQVLRDCYDTLKYVGTFNAVLRHSADARTAIDTTIAKLTHLNEGGKVEAYRQLQTRADLNQ